MNGGEVLVETLIARGVDTVFFVPGGTYTTVLRALSEHANAVRALATRLESSAVFAAIHSSTSAPFMPPSSNT